MMAFAKSLLSSFSHGNAASLISQRGRSRQNATWPIQHNPKFCKKSLRVNGLFGGGNKDNTEDGQSKLSSSQSQAHTLSLHPLPRGAGEGVKEDARSKLLQVVLVSPQIPGNTGCIARTCAASAVGLHLVGPLGFQVDDARVKRAGLDYWPYVVVKAHSSWAEFREYFRQQEGEKRMIAFTKRGTKIHSEFSYQRGDYLLFGSETSGLPLEALSDCKNESYGGGTIRIPMVETYVRCLNLSVSVGVALYEASRQLNYEQVECAPEGCVNGEEPLFAEDIFA